MSTTELRQKLHEYIDNAGAEDLEDINTMIEDKNKPYDKWEDEEFVAEMERRVRDYEAGTEKTYTLEEVMSRAQDTIKKARAK